MRLVLQNLVEGNGNWEVIPFQLWGFLSIKSSLPRKEKKKKVNIIPKHLIKVFCESTL